MATKALVIDDEEDYTFPTWSGVIPLEITAGEPVNDDRLLPGQTVPPYASRYSRKLSF